jgi:2,3-bisphosphoglycerate-independent phosphoglycerate mutase
MKKVALIILDGWGIAPDGPGNAISLANTPTYDLLIAQRPHATLKTSGEDVGLPEGQMGNSEVGHLNIGAGRIVWQELANINKLIREDKLKKNDLLIKTFTEAKSNNKRVHFMGLVSDGGVHSHHNHLIELCKIANDFGLKEVFIHAFTDGRDTDPRGAMKYITEVENAIINTTGKIATIIGRYYAMDRDKRWERVKIAYDALVTSTGEKSNSWKDALSNSYANNITDEFVKPIIVCENNNPIAAIQNGDIVICFNFRTDRCREITSVLTQTDYPEFKMSKLNLHYVTMTRYDESFNNVDVLLEKDNLALTLGEVLENNNKSQIRIAETEKYPHVTFFFSGGREQPFKNEKRIMIASPKVATYDLQPEMSANEITEAILPELKNGNIDFICLNFANTDMVGHTGVIPAAIKAVETVDSCLGKILEAGKESNYTFIIIADHGNADVMLNEDGSPNTAHSTNPVPIILVDEDNLKINSGRLCDIAPTILDLFQIEKPSVMNGHTLLKRSTQ